MFVVVAGIEAINEKYPSTLVVNLHAARTSIFRCYINDNTDANPGAATGLTLMSRTTTSNHIFNAARMELYDATVFTGDKMLRVFDHLTEFYSQLRRRFNANRSKKLRRYRPA